MTFIEAVNKIKEEPNFMGLNLTEMTFVVYLNEDAQDKSGIENAFGHDMEFEDVENMSKIKKFSYLVVSVFEINVLTDTYTIEINLGA